MNLLFNSTSLTAILLAVFLIGSNGQTTFDTSDPDIIIPNIESTFPADGDTNVERGTTIEITFSEDMDTELINNQTFALIESPKDMEAKEKKEYGEEREYKQDREQREREQEEEWEKEQEEVEYERDQKQHEQDMTRKGEKKTIHGTVEVENNTVKFIPNQTLRAHTTYTLTMNGEEIHTQEGVRHEQDQEWHDERDQDWREEQEQDRDWRQDQERNQDWQQDQQDQWSVSFTTGGREEPLKLVDLGSAKGYVILAEQNVENEEGSEITGELGKKDDPDRERQAGMERGQEQQEHEQEEAERQERRDQYGERQAHLNIDKAFEDMMKAYEDAEGRSDPDFTDVYEGKISGKTLTPGLYKFNNSIEIDSTVTLSGSEEDVWIFQLSDDLKINENVRFQLEDGTTAENVFWQVAGEVSVGSNSHMEGIVLAKNDIKLESQASINGRMMAQSIILDQNNVTDPQRATGLTRTGGM